jgi:predicted nucleotide-binding protein
MPKKPIEPPRQPVALAQDIARAKEALSERMKLGKELADRPVSHGGDAERAKADIDNWTAYNLTLLERMFTTDEIAREYGWTGHGLMIPIRSGPPSVVEQYNSARQLLTARMQYLESLLGRIDLYAPASSPAPLPTRASPAVREPASATRVFVVHGQDDGARESVARFLEKAGLQAIILHEQASRGDTVIEKLERNSDVHFAVVLLTGDDEGRRTGDTAPPQPRARQNVILELGYFVAKLGRERVCALYEEGVELPSDWNGVVWVALDTHDAWKYKLAKELRAAGFQIDMNGRVRISVFEAGFQFLRACPNFCVRGGVSVLGICESVPV